MGNNLGDAAVAGITGGVTAALCGACLSRPTAVAQPVALVPLGPPRAVVVRRPPFRRRAAVLLASVVPESFLPPLFLSTPTQISDGSDSVEVQTIER